jgi:hypothetical protein
MPTRKLISPTSVLSKFSVVASHPRNGHNLLSVHLNLVPAYLVDVLGYQMVDTHLARNTPLVELQVPTPKYRNHYASKSPNHLATAAFLLIPGAQPGARAVIPDLLQKRPFLAQPGTTITLPHLTIPPLLTPPSVTTLVPPHAHVRDISLVSRSILPFAQVPGLCRSPHTPDHPARLQALRIHSVHKQSAKAIDMILGRHSDQHLRMRTTRLDLEPVL